MYSVAVEPVVILVSVHVAPSGESLSAEEGGGWTGEVVENLLGPDAEKVKTTLDSVVEPDRRFEATETKCLVDLRNVLEELNGLDEGR